MTGLIQVWHIMVVVFGVGAADAIEQPARFAFLMDIVGKEDLTNAVGLNSSLVNGARIIGPAIAGVLIRWGGESGCFFLNSLTYLAVIAALLAMRLPAWTRPLKPLRLKGDLTEGLKYMWQDPIIRGLFTLIVAPCFLAAPYAVLMPIFARDVLQVDSSGYGLLMSAIGVGAVCGALGVASLRAGHRGRWLILWSLAFPLSLILFSLSQWFAPSIGFLVLVGASQIAQQSLAASLLQLASADEFRGRVVSFFALLNNGLTRLGGVQAGAVSQYWSAPFAVLGGALLSLVWVLMFVWRTPVVRRLS
jgi:MFS family permease